MTDDDKSLAFNNSLLMETLRTRADEIRAYLERKLTPRVRAFFTADDILQETFTVAYESIGKFCDEGPGSMDRWVWQIAQNQLINAINFTQCIKRGGAAVTLQDRQARLTSMVSFLGEVEAGDRSPSSEVAMMETLDRVKESLVGLTSEDQELIQMFFFEGQSLADIAETLGTTSPAVRGRIFRALRKLQEHLGPATKYYTGAPAGHRKS